MFGRLSDAEIYMAYRYRWRCDCQKFTFLVHSIVSNNFEWHL